MKKVEAVIRSSDLEPIRGPLLAAVEGPILADETVCFGPSVQEVRVYRGSSYVCDMLPCVRLSMVVRDECLAAAAEVLRPMVQRGPAREMGLVVSDVAQLAVFALPPGPTNGHAAREPVREERERLRAFAFPGGIVDPIASTT